MIYSLVLISEKNEWQFIEFNTSKKELKRAYLEQIDYVTCGYQNVEEFLTSLSKQVEFKFAPKDVAIVYRYNKQWKKKKLIFNDLKLRARAYESLHKKVNEKARKEAEKALKKDNQKTRNEAILLENDYEMQELCAKIKGYSLVDYIYKYMGETTRTFPYHIYQLLEKYRNANKIIGHDRTDEIEDKSNSVLYNLRDYMNYRNIRIWMQKYEQYRIKKNLPEINDEILKKLVENYELEEINVDDALDFAIREFYQKEAQKNVVEQTTEEEISNYFLRTLYDKYDGDIERIIEVLGTDFMDNLSDEDQQLSGYSDYKRRKI